MIYNMKSRVQKTMSQLKNSSRIEVYRKLYVLVQIFNDSLGFVILLPFSISLLAIIRFISPIVVIRFDSLVSWRIGHYAGNIDMYLCEKKAGINLIDKKTVDIWCDRTKSCNTQLTKMWKQNINIIPKWILYPIIILNNIIPGGKLHKIPKTKSDDKDILNLATSICKEPNIRFTEEEEVRGQEGLLKLGIDINAKYVCLTVRDSAYLEKQKRESRSGVDWSYHDYRNSEIDDYKLAALELVKLGYYVIRMGVVAEKSFSCGTDKVIDYAFKGLRTDFMDIYLGAKCEFCITTATGYDAIPSLFRKPLLVVNYTHIEYFQTNPKTITIFKIIRDMNSNYLSIKTILDKGIGRFGRTNQFRDAGVELIANKPEEIRDAAIEMVLRLEDKWDDSWYDVEVKDKVACFFSNSKLNGDILSRYGTQFLKDNLYLLDDN
jgi:putative glycosyltransferase (TIGR04372 family)